MAEEFGDKTEAPTPRRREEARERGQIARSPDLTAALVVMGTLVLLKSFGPNLVDALRALVGEMLGGPSMANADLGQIGPVMLRATLSVAAAMAPVLAGVLVIAFLANVLQVGLHFNIAKLQPNFGAINPLKGLGRLFGKKQALVQLAMNVMKLMLVSLVAYSAVHGRLEQIVTVQQLSFLQIFGLGAQIVYSIGMRLGMLMLVLAILDYSYQRWRMEQEMKMSKQEVKEEMKRMDGDPQVKQRRKQLVYQQALHRLRGDVPKADVVVTNPTEFAVAIRYDHGTMTAPRVVAKGQGYMAQRIREIAIANGVPILERKPLARALFKLVDVGQEIPEQFYTAVAEILAYVYELTGKLRKAKMVG